MVQKIMYTVHYILAFHTSNKTARMMLLLACYDVYISHLMGTWDYLS